MTAVTLRVNGIEITKSVAPRMHLADFVREELNLTGTHLGCEHGVCGACTMMVDGRPVRSCISYAIACAGSDVHTIESFDDDPVMDMLRSAFTRHHALQCGYCTPGMLATAYDIVTRLPDADEARIREELSGNLCRCTGYVGIVAAIGEVLRRGPHQSGVRPSVAAPQGSSSWTRGIHAVGAAIRAQSESVTEVPRRIDGGTTLRRSLPVPIAVDQLWTTLQNVETIARCLPGAIVESVDRDGKIAGAFEVGIGPMRARFRGTAWVTFNSADHAGWVRGAGGDGVSRSRADGVVRFAARPIAADRSQLDLEIVYKLNGPLAQFGRPALVANVVDVLLGDLATNLVATASGATLKVSPVNGIRLLLATLRAIVNRMFSSQ
jgi:aerobic carbon-monoxide dehydrogenase small subunit